MKKRKSDLFLIMMLALLNPAFSQDKKEILSSAANWFPYFDFDPAVFKDPPRSVGPFTRWWWPGNDVMNEELQREIKLLADNGFAGVEIQPLTMGINPDAPGERLDKVYSWDGPSFYKHLKTTMQQAKVSGITVDLNGGSGWPIGGPHVKPAESMLTLAYSDTVVNGGQDFSITVPKHLPDYSKITIFDTHLYQAIDQSYAKLQKVVAAKILKKENGHTFLDSSSIFDLTRTANDNKISFSLPQKGEWKIIAYWSVPDGQIPTVIASRDPGLVANHFDSVSIIKNYDHLFGERAGLQYYYGDPMRAVFNDSYEFRSDRHYSNDFMAFFKEQRGYDITPWLGACLQKGYNNNAGFFLFPDAKAPFVFSDEDWRIQYDYDLTIGELLQQQFIKASDNWMHDRGMLHRTQAYGIKTDVIASAGAADIPEAEQLFAKGSEGFIKLVTSGAHLYNRPVITQESFVFLGRSEMTTPQKLKALSDKAFTCGINQIIYSGTSYKYLTDDYGKEGWNTWSTPYSGFDFSANINESYTYWNDIKKVNEYITRAQYVLRSGRPQSDVLIYFPFADFTQEDLLENPEEMFANGYFKGIEPMQNEVPEQSLSLKEHWFKEVWKTINTLNASGITWEWVNDVSLREANPENGNIVIRGNRYQALIIANAPYIQTETAENIKQLSKASAKILLVGNAPEKQPGFLNYISNDATTKQDIGFALLQANSRQIKDSMQLLQWINNLGQPIKLNITNRFMRTINREMSDGSIAKFIWNPTGQLLRLSFFVADTFKNIYWLDASSGNIIKANKSGSVFDNMLPPYGSVILYASNNEIDETKLSSPQIFSHGAKELMQLNDWNIRSDNASIDDTVLFDWRTNDAFKYKSGPGVYTTSFNLTKEKQRKYLIDLGKVYFTAEVQLNGKVVGKAIWSPYELDITDALKNGENKLEISVVPTRRNAFIYEADHGNRFYKQFKGKANELMPAGLEGPVRIMIY